jgi:hypothetical protein
MTRTTPPTRPLTTKEGWQSFLDNTPVIPTMHSPDVLAAMDPDARGDDDERRLAYHAQFVTVATPQMRKIAAIGQQLVVLNRHQTSARRGLIVTGAATLGKTTAITQLGKAHELRVRRRTPETAQSNRIPVVYITVPPAATPRMIAVEFARFLGMHAHRAMNITDIINSVCQLMSDTRSELVLVDEIHNINLASRSGADVADTLKYFAERLPATFVYAGLDVERVGLLSGTRGRQIAGRFALLEITPFGHGSDEQRNAWAALVAALEQSLRLRNHTPGTLVNLAAHLHDRCAGSIGSLSHLLRAAAIDAIIDGTEKITRAALDAVLLDRSAEAARPPATAKRRKKAADVA